ncbi:MAG: Leader peptidase PppA, partial [Pseudomonadota bacterium]
MITLTAWPQLWLPPGSMGWVMPHFVDVSWAEIILMAAIGLVIGSFVNVLIHRLPQMILTADESSPVSFNLSTPRSHCPHCRHTLSWYELIPVLSFVGSFGRCKHCNEAISFRYPGVELLTAVLFCMSLLKFGFGYSALLGGFFCA